MNGDNCYFYFANQTVSWSDANGVCVYWGGQLALPFNAQQNQLVATLIASQTNSSTATWLGLSGLNSDKVWRDCNGAVTDFNNWGKCTLICDFGFYCVFCLLVLVFYLWFWCC